MSQNCGNCAWWQGIGAPEEAATRGKCKFPMPYAVIETDRTNSDEGATCPCHKPAEEKGE